MTAFPIPDSLSLEWSSMLSPESNFSNSFRICSRKQVCSIHTEYNVHNVHLLLLNLYLNGWEWLVRHGSQPVGKDAQDVGLHERHLEVGLVKLGHHNRKHGDLLGSWKLLEIQVAVLPKKDREFKVDFQLRRSLRLPEPITSDPQVIFELVLT